MVYQTASFSISTISRQAAMHLFSHVPELLVEQAPKHVRWVATTVKEVRNLAGPLMAESGYACAGATRALKTKSERWTRVVAHIIPQIAISHLTSRNQLQVDFHYVLFDEAGEIHPPKDEMRNEMLLSPVVVSEARVQIRADLLEMVEKKIARLSPAFLRQLGLEEQAMALEAESSQINLQRLQQARASRVPKWDVSHIVEERGAGHRREYLVEWAGYHPSWEAWRMNGPGGAVGSPLQTWEPAQALRGTEALLIWQGQVV